MKQHNRVSLAQIIDVLPHAKSYGSYIMGLCPFHDDRKPSLMAFEDGWFRCLACGTTGSLERLLRKLNGFDHSQVMREATEWHPPSLPAKLDSLEVVAEDAHYALRTFEQFQWYIAQQRGIPGRIEPNRLGWYRGWYTVPIYDIEHKFQGLIMRAGSHIQQASGQRFHQPKGQLPMLYCPDYHLLENAKAIGVVFGIFDALTLAELRFPVVTTTLGKDSFDPRWLDGFRKPVAVIPDKGEEDSAIRLANRLGWRGSVVRLNYPDDCKDPNDFLRTGRASQLVAQLTGAIG